jgi:hypothetical protein
MYTCQCGDVESDIGSGAKKFLFKRCELNDFFINYVWNGLVADYSARLLTLPGDRLPAFSGLAKNFENTWKTLTEHHKASVTSGHKAARMSGFRDDSIVERTFTATALTEKAVPKDLGNYLAGLWSNYLEIEHLWAQPIPDPPLIAKPA